MNCRQNYSIKNGVAIPKDRLCPPIFCSGYVKPIESIQPTTHNQQPTNNKQQTTKQQTTKTTQQKTNKKQHTTNDKEQTKEQTKRTKQQRFGTISRMIKREESNKILWVPFTRPRIFKNKTLKMTPNTTLKTRSQCNLQSAHQTSFQIHSEPPPSGRHWSRCATWIAVGVIRNATFWKLKKYIVSLFFVGACAFWSRPPGRCIYWALPVYQVRLTALDQGGIEPRPAVSIRARRPQLNHCMAGPAIYFLVFFPGAPAKNNS